MTLGGFDFDLVGHRKWLAGVLCLAMIQVSLGLGWLTGAQFVTALQWTLGLFVGGNVFEHIAKRGGQ